MFKFFLFIFLILSHFLTADYHEKFLSNYDYDVSVNDSADCPTSTLEFLFKPSNRKTLYQISVFTPLWFGEKDFIFWDARGSRDNCNAIEGNFGLCYRRILEGNNFFPYNLILDFHSFYDIRSNKNDDTFHQAVVGSEILFDMFDVHFNYYYPLFEPDNIPARKNNSRNNSIDYGMEKYLSGCDFEFRFKFPLNFSEKKSLWLSAGFFDFERWEKEEVSGPRFGLELLIDDFFLFSTQCSLGFKTEYERDNLRGNCLSCSARIKIPLGLINKQNVSFTFPSVSKKLGRKIVRNHD